MDEHIKQFENQLKSTKHILLVLAFHAQADHLCAAAALAKNLRSQNKQVDIVQEQFQCPSKLLFLENQFESIQPHLPAVQTLHIEIDITNTPLSEMSYDVIDNKLKIKIQTKEGVVAPKKVQSHTSKYKYDCAIIIGASTLKDIGSMSHTAADMWHTLPIINIDTAPSNERFGNINIVNIAAPSISVLIFDILKHLNQHTLKKQTATLILTGIILATKSFKTPNVTPHLLSTVSKLMDMGADREYISNQLYRTRTVNSLKLWGSVLSNLHYHEQHSITSCVITRDVFIQSKTTEDELIDITDEILLNSPQAKIIVLIYESRQGNSTHAHIHTTVEHDARMLTEPFTGQKTEHHAHLHFSTPIQDVEQTIVTHITQQLEKKIE